MQLINWRGKTKHGSDITIVKRYHGGDFEIEMAGETSSLSKKECRVFVPQFRKEHPEAFEPVKIEFCTMEETWANGDPYKNFRD